MIEPAKPQDQVQLFEQAVARYNQSPIKGKFFHPLGVMVETFPDMGPGCFYWLVEGVLVDEGQNPDLSTDEYIVYLPPTEDADYESVHKKGKASLQKMEWYSDPKNEETLAKKWQDMLNAMKKGETVNYQVFDDLVKELDIFSMPNKLRSKIMEPRYEWLQSVKFFNKYLPEKHPVRIVEDLLFPSSNYVGFSVEFVEEIPNMGPNTAYYSVNCKRIGWDETHDRVINIPKQMVDGEFPVEQYSVWEHLYDRATFWLDRNRVETTEEFYQETFATLKSLLENILKPNAL